MARMTQQKWAQTRNWNKKILLAIRSNLQYLLNSSVITPTEWNHLDLALRDVKAVAFDWEHNNPISKMDNTED